MLAAFGTRRRVLKCISLTRSGPRHANSDRKRYLSTSHLHPTIQDFTAGLAERQPYFRMKPENVRILSKPDEFYQNLLAMIRRAQYRIFLSSLYIGSEETELIDTILTQLRARPSLRVHIHLDYNRSTRPGHPSTISVLLPLIKEFPDRVHVALFRSPKLKGLMAKIVPARFNEGWGTWHAKLYGTDDEVIISGANLNKSYFTNRQDRYIHFVAHLDFTQYCYKFLHTASEFSYKLYPTQSGEGYDLIWLSPLTPSSHFERKANQLLTGLQGESAISSIITSNRRIMNQKNLDLKEDVLVFPIIQAGQFGIREEEACLGLLFEHLHDHRRFKPTLELTSGYFGLYKSYQDLVLLSNVDCQIMCASPKANGFYGSKGISGRIPEGYTLLERRFMRAVIEAGRVGHVRLQEWEKDGWTYHAKGIWLRPKPTSLPALTLFGSTNLNSRSSNLDTELSFVMATSSEDLRIRLDRELSGLKESAKPWQGDERDVTYTTEKIVNLVGGML